MTKKSGRPPLRGKALTQAERHQRWKTNLELRKKGLLQPEKLTKKRINLALGEPVLDGVKIIAESLDVSTTVAIEILLHRAAKQASEILDEWERQTGSPIKDAESLALVRFFIRTGHNIERIAEWIDREAGLEDISGSKDNTR